MWKSEVHHGTFFEMKEVPAFLAVEHLLSRCLHSAIRSLGGFRNLEAH